MPNGVVVLARRGPGRSRLARAAVVTTLAAVMACGVAMAEEGVGEGLQLLGVLAPSTTSLYRWTLQIAADDQILAAAVGTAREGIQLEIWEASSEESLGWIRRSTTPLDSDEPPLSMALSTEALVLAYPDPEPGGCSTDPLGVIGNWNSPDPAAPSAAPGGRFGRLWALGGPAWRVEPLRRCGFRPSGRTFAVATGSVDGEELG